METRILLDEEMFIKLISGQIIDYEGIRIALQDIGYERMLDIIEQKLQILNKSYVGKQ